MTFIKLKNPIQEGKTDTLYLNTDLIAAVEVGETEEGEVQVEVLMAAPIEGEEQSSCISYIFVGQETIPLLQYLDRNAEHLD